MKNKLSLLFTLVLVLFSLLLSTGALALTVTPSPHCEGDDCCISSDCFCPNCWGDDEAYENNETNTDFPASDTKSDGDADVQNTAPLIKIDDELYNATPLSGLHSWSILAVLLTIFGVIIAALVTLNSLKQKKDEEKRRNEHLKTLRNTDKNSYYKATAILENEKRHNQGHRITTFVIMQAFVLASFLLLILMQNFDGVPILFNRWVLPHVILALGIIIIGKYTLRRALKIPIAAMLALTLIMGGSAIALSMDTAIDEVCPCESTDVAETLKSRDAATEPEDNETPPKSNENYDNYTGSNNIHTNKNTNEDDDADNEDEPQDPIAQIDPFEGTLPIYGNPWLGETLTYGTGAIVIYDSEGNSETQIFTPDMLKGWHHRWRADGEVIKGANGTTYTVSALDRTEYGNDVMNAQIGLTLLSDCGNFILRQENRTAPVPFDVRLEYEAYPPRRAEDNATLYSDYSDNHPAIGRFMRQLAGKNVDVNNYLSSGNMGIAVGNSKADFRVGDKDIGELTTRGTGKVTYAVNPADAINGVITIHASYTHRGIAVDTPDLNFGNQTCTETLQVRGVTITNIGNTDTGAINLSIIGGDTDAFVIDGATSIKGLSAYGEQAVVNIRPSPDNIANEADSGIQNNENLIRTPKNAYIRVSGSDVFDRSIEVTVVHAESNFTSNGENCRTICTVEECGRVIKTHESIIPAWSAWQTDNGTYHFRQRDTICLHFGCMAQHYRLSYESHNSITPNWNNDWTSNNGIHMQSRADICIFEGCTLNHNREVHDGHDAAWKEYHDLIPTQLQHGKSCTHEDCTVQLWEYHDIVVSKSGVNNPDQHHLSSCITCSLVFSAPHTGKIWNRTTVTDDVCEHRSCTDCGRIETRAHLVGAERQTRAVRIGNIPVQQLNTTTHPDLSSSFNPALPAGNTQHRVEHVCAGCTRPDHTISPNRFYQNHTMGSWTGWGDGGPDQCIRRRTCTVPGCEFQQRQVGLHTLNADNSKCTRCNSTGPFGCRLLGNSCDIALMRDGQWAIHWADDSRCRQFVHCRICGGNSNAGPDGTVPHSFTVNLGGGRLACNRCSTCNNHWNNNEWTNNGINERRAGECASPDCAAAAPVEYRPHTWSNAWSRNATEHWQYCTTCPANNRARTNLEYHDFGDWFFFGQSEEICQRKFGACICGEPNPETKRGHDFDTDGYCIRPGCRWGV